MMIEVKTYVKHTYLVVLMKLAQRDSEKPEVLRYDKPSARGQLHKKEFSALLKNGKHLTVVMACGCFKFMSIWDEMRITLGFFMFGGKYG